MDRENMIHWLREGEDWEAADVLSQCEFRYDYIDAGIPLGGGPDIDIVELNIHASRQVLARISGKPAGLADQIEHAVREFAQAHRCYVRDIRWVPRLKSPPSSPSDDETEKILAELGSEYIKSAWAKALARRKEDPDGAISAAKTLLESVCKHILKESGVSYPQNPEIGTLYHLTSKHLELSPEEHIDKNIKRILGNCQAVVGGVAFLRNKLGDAHSPEPGSSAADEEQAELAINLAGAVATFLARHWETFK